MARQSTTKTGFLWLGGVMLLPVFVLALAGLASIRKDRLSVFQEARESAGASAQQFAELLQANLPSRLVAIYLDALQVDSTNLPAGTTINRDGWKVAMPEYTQLLASLPAHRRALAAWAGGLRWIESGDGRLVWPPSYQPAPTPEENVPADWRKLQSGDMARNGKEILRQYAALATNATEARAESGIPLAPLAAYRWLQLARQSATGEVRTAAAILAERAFAQPSILSPVFLRAAANAYSPPAGTADFQLSPPGLLENWAVAEDARAWHEHWHATRAADSPVRPGVPVWAQYAGQDWLVIPVTILGQNGKTNQLAQIGYQLFPEILLRAAIREHFGAPQFRLPAFAALRVMMNGRELVAAAGETLAEIPVDVTMAPWGTQFAKQETGKASLHLTLSVQLANPEMLYALQRQRARLFGGLIAVACAVAVAGFWLSWRAFRRQLQLNEQKSNFVSSVSHELRAPIASVRLMAENLQRGKISEPAKQGEYFCFIVQECRRLSSLIENVLDFSRIEQGRKHYEFEPTNLGALVEATVKLMEPYANEKGVKLQLETSNIQHPTSNIELNVDGRAVQQALVNLIDNAVKHSPKSGTVTVGLEMKNEELRIKNGGNTSRITHHASRINLSVSDHGPGIPAAEHEKIFERFYRRGSELRRETQGVGIGLSIVKHIAEAHGGRVVVESKVGQGSRFTIELPMNNKETKEQSSE